MDNEKYYSKKFRMFIITVLNLLDIVFPNNKITKEALIKKKETRKHFLNSVYKIYELNDKSKNIKEDDN